MSYDFYCYRPSSDKPSAEEAQGIIVAQENGTFRDDPDAREIKEKIAAALINFNPRLERFIFDYSKIAEMNKVSEEQARARWNHIELNPPEKDLAIQAWIHWDHVLFSIPYWYTGARADQVFAQLLAYLRIVKEAAGFFAYDPQINRAFNPEIEKMMLDNSEYARISTNLPAIIAQGQAAQKKPWWKFW